MDHNAMRHCHTAQTKCSQNDRIQKRLSNCVWMIIIICDIVHGSYTAPNLFHTHSCMLCLSSMFKYWLKAVVAQLGKCTNETKLTWLTGLSVNNL